MRQNSLIAYIVPLLIVFFLATSSFFIVGQGQQALVLQFGRLVRIEKDPGLQFKIPFMQDIIYYDNRILDFDMQALEATLGDQKRLTVDTFTRYRIAEPEIFYRTVRNEQGAKARLEGLNSGIVLSILGKVKLSDVLSAKREEITKQIRDQMNTEAKDFGVQVVDLRLRRTDLPVKNSEAIFSRMISERKQESQEFRSRGDEMAQEIKSKADKEKTIILADARKQSQILRGEGDAIVTDISAQAYGQDPEFFDFYQSLQAYEKGLASDSTTYILSPTNTFFKYFGG
ncbi:Modulator of FtsH protease HflC [Candidatus Bealeia paramacronuclearis]|uniref:Protein HflC n=1 Tax=Candidatus Bealeia paramacronuclearis TaxID=1921001 RepID=A0ABZ2C383_9PROT|nr:Modulator of FtsH protease HflC [Candidatus Bealeia paramacronuclearis]